MSGPVTPFGKPGRVLDPHAIKGKCASGADVLVLRMLTDPRSQLFGERICGLSQIADDRLSAMAVVGSHYFPLYGIDHVGAPTVGYDMR
jgi:hypothetical protein